MVSVEFGAEDAATPVRVACLHVDRAAPLNTTADLGIDKTSRSASLQLKSEISAADVRRLFAARA